MDHGDSSHDDDNATGSRSSSPAHSDEPEAAAPSAEDLDDAIFLQVACHLPARDLAALAGTARRFTAARFSDPHAAAGDGPPAERWLPEEAARLHLASLSQAEQDWAPRRAPSAAVQYIRRQREIEKLREPLRFTQSGPALHHIEDGELSVALASPITGKQSAQQLTSRTCCACLQVPRLFVAPRTQHSGCPPCVATRSCAPANSSRSS